MKLLKTLVLGALSLALLTSHADAADLWRAKGQPAFVNQNGKPYANGKFCYFEAGTTDALTVYKDALEATAWSQPISLNSAGALGDPIYVPAGSFKEVFLPSTAESCDETPLFTDDDIPGAFDIEALGLDSARPERPILSKAANYTVAAEDFGSVIDVDATSDAVTVSLAGATNGSILTVRKRDGSANAVIVDTSGVETIDGEASYTLTKANETVTVVSDGSSWRTIDTPSPGTVAFDKLALDAWDDDPTLTADSDVTLPTQGAVKSYVDAVAVAGVKWKSPARVATVTSGTLASDFEDGDTVDDITLATGDRILIKNQSSATENGIYVVQASGAPSRAADANEDAEIPGSTLLVREGTSNGNTTWANSNDAVEIGTDAIGFVQTAGSNVYVADDTTLELNGQEFRIKNLGVATGKIADTAVTEGKIAGGAVSVGKLATDVQNRLKPVGDVFQFAGGTCPAYSVTAHGQAISRSTYSALYTVTGDAFGAGNGSTTFNVPDLRGRAVFGDDNMGGTTASRLTSAISGITGTTLGATGGDQQAQQHGHSDSFTLPDHTHSDGSYGTNSDSHDHFIGINTSTTASSGSTSPNVRPATASGDSGGDTHSHDVTGNSGNPNSNPAISGSVGDTTGTKSGGDSGNIPPAIVLTVCIQTGV